MARMNRRRFLEDSLLALTAVSAASRGFGSATSLFAQDEHVETATSPNEKLGLAIIGGGSRGGDHIKGFLDDKRSTILYICDPDPSREDARLDRIAEMQGGLRPKFVTDMRKAFEDPAVDIVSCATTNHWHALCCLWALEHGKHCYLEKPVSHNMHEGFALEAAVKKYGKIVQAGTQCRSGKACIDAARFIRDGGIGNVDFARGLCYKRRKAIGAKGDYPIPEGVDYDLWSGPARMLPVTRRNFHYDWHWQREYGNGDLGNQGPHQTDIARWFLDLDRYPNSVISYGGRLGYQAQMKDDGYVDAGDTANTEVSIYDFGDKCIVFETRGLETKPCTVPGFDAIGDGLGDGIGTAIGTGVGVIAYGSEGYLVQSRLDRQVYDYCAAYDMEGNLVKEFVGGDNHYGNFVDAVLADDASILNAPIRVGAISAALSHMGNISYYLGENNKVPVSELETALKEIKSLDPENNSGTLERTVEHLKANGVDLDKYPLSLGPLLTFDSEKKTFADPAAQKLATREYRDGYAVE
ncbi:MAG TPA: gfo/Idh/MocA family oxidoreductase [Planctomycetaceae bacterium]|nr:gfo/Idh/MocA family oxidoreductase [Planctomycetaceae bacterium]